MSVVLKILEELSHGFSSDQQVLGALEPYDAGKWRAVFVGSEELAPTHHADEDVAWLLHEHPSPLTRQQILAIDHPDPVIRARRIVIASLMWGYGTTGLRYPKRLNDVATLLAAPSLKARLNRCADRLLSCDIRGAYATLTDIPGVRSSFFTKFLYFLGRSRDSNWEYPLILDTLVAESLGWLTGYRDLVALESYWPGSDAASYVSYVRTMHGWARHLGTTADVLEYYLWHPPKAEFQATCRRLHGTT